MTVDAAFRTALCDNVAAMGFRVSEPAVAAMWRHFTLVIERNRSINLTRILDPGEAAVKHYADSLALAAWAQATAHKKLPSESALSLLDVGTGAGFPAVPLAIVCPSWRITAIDGTRKKTDFLSSVAAELELTNLRVENTHSDHWPTAARFDVVTFRALAAMDKGLAKCARFARPGGFVVAYKTAQLSPDELATAKAPPARLCPVDPFLYELRCGDEVLRRALYALRKTMK